MSKTGVAYLPLHPGKAPRWLFSRMIELSEAILELSVDEIGTRKTLERFSDPFWFQAFSCVLGFDWHSSGTTTVTCGAVKEALSGSDIGIYAAGGKGRNATQADPQIVQLCEQNSISIDIESVLRRSSKLAAKVDSAALQDGYELYHHVILFDNQGNWSVVQQGMCEESGYARRYHWSSEKMDRFDEEPHTSILGERMNRVLDLTSRLSRENKAICCDLVKEDPKRIREVVRAAARGAQRSILEWTLEGEKVPSVLHMPRDVSWSVLRRCYDIQPRDFEELLSIEGVGPSTVRALSYTAEIVYGTEPSWRDPVKFSFAVGGKDGVPFPVDKNAMDKTIQVLRQGIEEAKLGNKEKLDAFRRLRRFIPPDYDWS